MIGCFWIKDHNPRCLCGHTGCKKHAQIAYHTPGGLRTGSNIYCMTHARELGYDKSMQWLYGLQSVGNQWIKFPKFHTKAYLRYTRRYLNSSIVETIEIGSVEVSARQRRKGQFTAFLRFMEDIAQQHKRVIFVENIMEKWFLNFFIRRGYAVCGPEIGLSCAFKAFSDLTNSLAGDTLK